MTTFIRTDALAKWLKKLADATGRARILARLDAAAFGNFGDRAPVGESVSEMRIHTGPGYRVHYTRRDALVYVLLLGGNKSTQTRDIKRAIRIARKLEERA